MTVETFDLHNAITDQTQCRECEVHGTVDKVPRASCSVAEEL